jgi:hypothetical protein
MNRFDILMGGGGPDSVASTPPLNPSSPSLKGPLNSQGEAPPFRQQMGPSGQVLMGRASPQFPSMGGSGTAFPASVSGGPLDALRHPSGLLPSQLAQQQQHQQQQQQQQSLSGLGHPPVGLSPGHPGLDILPRIPPFTFQPQSWVYRDPSGVIQGPFTAQQMQDWYTEGFFPSELPIKKMSDPVFSPLNYLVGRFGPKMPFLAELEDSHAAARLIYESRIADMVNASSLRSSGLPLGGLSSAPQGQIHNTGMGHPGFSNQDPVSLGRQQYPPSQGYPQQPAREPVLQQQQHQQRQDPQAPLQSQMQNLTVQEQPSPAPAPVMEKKAAPAQQQQQVQQQAQHQVQPKKPVVTVPPTSSEAQQEQQQALKKSPAPISPTPAPWASSSPTTSSGNPSSLKHIQSQEEKLKSAVDKAQQKASQEKVLAEAARLKEEEERQRAKEDELRQKATEPAWGAAPPSPSKKTLSEIMRDEQKGGSSVPAKSTAGGSLSGGTSAKRYADLIASPLNNTSAHPSARSVPGVAMATSAPIKPTAQQHSSRPGTAGAPSGWQTVGKGGQAVPPPAAPAPVAPKPLVPTPHAGISVPGSSSSLNSGGPAKAYTPSADFVSWFQSALRSVPPSSDVNVKALFSILESISDKSFVSNVCDDTLGGIPSIDARKFADEYWRRRVLDEQKVKSGSGGAGLVGGRGASLSPGASPVVAPPLESGFVTVTKKKGKKK